jgi:hypothetical protein
MIMTCENAEAVFIRGAKPPTKIYIPSTINIQMNLALLLSLVGLGCQYWEIIRNFKQEEL